MDAQSLIAFRDCSKKFGTQKVLENITFEITGKNSFISLLGKSGSGKTTLIRLLAGLEKPDSGEIHINGEKVSEAGRILVPPHRRNVGFIFQDLALYPHFTAFENICFGLKLKKVDGYRSIAEDIMKKFGIDLLKNNYPSQLSGGQQQLVALARSLVLNPAILLMDEPLANLDVQLKTQIRELLQRIVIEREITIIYVTHDHKEAIEMSDKILVLNDNFLVFVGTSDEMKNSDNLFIKDFIHV